MTHTKSIFNPFLIYGKSGSGKTYWIRKYIENYKQNQPIIYVSAKPYDRTLEPVKHLIDFEYDLHTIPRYLTIEKIHNNLPEGATWIFDDVETGVKELQIRVQTLIDLLLQQGREFDFNVIVVKHSFQDLKNKIIKEECENIVFFPNRSPTGFKKFLINEGYSRKDVKQILELTDDDYESRILNTRGKNTLGKLDNKNKYTVTGRLD